MRDKYLEIIDDKIQLVAEARKAVETLGVFDNSRATSVDLQSAVVRYLDKKYVLTDNQKKFAALIVAE